MKVYKHKDYDYVTIVEVLNEEIEKIDFCICKQPKERLGDFYNRQNVKPDVVINAGFFATKTGNSIFNLVDDGKVYSKHERYKWGMGVNTDHKRLKYCSLGNKDIVDFVSGYPNLVDGGKMCSPWTFANEINYKASRSMIGYNDNTVFFVTVDKPGMFFTQMAQLMIDIGCTYAVNLDGGGSSRMLVDGVAVNKPTENRAVDSVFACWLKKDKQEVEQTEQEDITKCLYAVQTGVFSSKKNAEVQANKLTQLGFVPIIKQVEVLT